MGCRRNGLIGIAAAWGLGGCAADLSRVPFDSAEHRPAAERALSRWTTDAFVTFEDERAFRRYLRHLRAAGRARGDWWAFETGDREESSDGEAIVVTGSRVTPRNASITNVQEAGVDEGDIVKQIDHYLLILQDGRIFVVDTLAGAAGLALSDRVNVYREPDSDMWYDEMLVHGDRIVVTGYSYEDQVSELAVFRLSAQGRLRSEGVFHISSDDYYDRENYATRLVDGDLLVYTPINLTGLDIGARLRLPEVRRWRSGNAGRSGQALFAADEIHRPLVTSFEPAIHTISICPLGPERAGRDLRCRSTAILGPAYRRLYFSPEAAYLWLVPSSEDDSHLIDEAACRPGRPAPEDNVRGALYRIPHRGGDPGVVAVRGIYFDHFAMQERDGEFRALVNDVSVRCDYSALDESPPYQFTFFNTPISVFGGALRDANRAGYTPLPSPPMRGQLADRFTDDYLVFGALGERRYRPGRRDDPPLDTPVVAVPVRNPGGARVLTVPHGVIRAEQAGEDIVLTGYRGPDALSVSLIDLSGTPRVTSTHRFEDRYESEGRSHAFNGLVGPDGSGLIALPTVPLAADGERTSSWSRPSDIDFLSIDAAGRLRGAGRLDTAARERNWERGNQSGLDGEPDQDDIPGYSCEVSCVDWYGNSRPIFSEGRIFALVATELIEGRLENGRIVEVRRLDLARTRPGRQAEAR